MSFPFFQGSSYLHSGGSEGRGEKQISQRKTSSKKETQSGVDNQVKWPKNKENSTTNTRST
ncbi:MAG: hypothetical protein ACMUEL_03770 [Flavobacteriales bacterium Tduv]